MKQRVLFFLKYYLFWVLFFMLQKLVFMLWQYRLLGEVSWHDWFLVMWHGLPLDFSVAAYITALPALLLIMSVWLPERVFHLIVDIYTAVVMAVGLMAMLADNGTFPAWGFRLDKTVFMYLSSPKEVLACAPWWQWVAAVVAFAVLMAVLWLAYRRLMRNRLGKITGCKRQCVAAFVMFLLTALLFLPIRGSVSVSTMNTGRVYYSSNQMLNLAAVNPVFNVVESLSEQNFDTRRYTYMSSVEAHDIVKTLTASCGQQDVEPLLLSPAPDIILIIWESMSANAWEALPCMHQVAEEGLWFTNAYSSSFRTDRGVVALLSAFPGQPSSSLMTAPAKTASLPFLSRDLQRNGYRLHWYYGGDEDFTNMRSYLLNGGFDNRVCDKSFPLGTRLSKWGVPDDILLDYCAQNICSRRSADCPQADVILTLSSHEPFEINTAKRFDSKYLNAMAYTDSCVGDFIDSLRLSAYWNNCLVVITGDHGYPYPESVRNYDPRRYHVPVLLTGGALARHGKVETLCSQTDIVPTLLAAMGLDHSAYLFGKDIFACRNEQWAFYSFNDGWGLLTDDGATVYDKRQEKLIIQTDTASVRERQGKALVQCIYEEIDLLQ